MHKNRYWLAVVFVVLLLFSVACSFSASTANVKDAQMYRDPDGKEQTTTFGPNDTFYLIVNLANAPDDTVTKATWTAIEAEGVDPNFEIDSSEITQGSGTLTFKLENSNLWPAGKYKVDLYLNDKLERTVEFEVQA